MEATNQKFSYIHLSLTKKTNAARKGALVEVMTNGIMSTSEKHLNT